MDFGDEESIYKVIPPTDEVHQKQRMYRSKHNAGRPPSYSTFGVAGSARSVANASGVEETFSAAKKVPPTNVAGTIDPKKFLKKNASVAAQGVGAHTVSSQPFRRAEAGEAAQRKPPVPSVSDKPIMGLKTDKKFVVSNAVECILSAPKKRPQDETLVAKPSYGQVPAYITKIKNEIRENAATNDSKQVEASIVKDEKLRKMPDAEVEQLNAGLKKRWAEANKALQTMSFSMETSGQLHRKDELEKEMKILDDAMKRLNKKFIFVYDDR